MQIVIDIPEETYQAIKSPNIDGSKPLTFNVLDAICFGRPLPKGHGRLIDADAIWDSYHDNGYDFYDAFYGVPTIIEADKEVDE